MTEADAEAFSLDLPTTVLGQLQRGRGVGWLSTLEASDGRGLLREALRFDPRWDKQVEARDDYYATLALELGLTGADLDPDMVAADERARNLGLSVLGRMALRGDAAAIARLRLGLERDDERWDALWSLSVVPDGKGISGIESTLARVCGNDELAGLVADLKRGLPWERWAATQPRIATAVRAAAMPDDEKGRVLAPPTPTADSPLAELLSFQWRGQYPRAVRHRLRTTTDRSEIRLLRDAAVGPWGPARKLALHALGERGDASALAIAAEVFDRDVVGQERASAVRYFLALEARVILPIAREWLEQEGDRWTVAVATMALHCESEDISSVRGAFVRAWQEGAIYEICDLVDAFARLADDGPHPEVLLTYEEIVYSYGRRRAAAALARTDQRSASTYAVESLWDCESETRMIGAKAADISCDKARARLRRLADDPFEDDDVRQVARAAL